MYKNFQFYKNLNREGMSYDLSGDDCAKLLIATGES
jgi:hypothetical protein